jgi:hypothetical protein
MALRSHSEIPVVTTILQTSRRFSMGPNDVELVRAYTREPGKQVADITFPVTSDFEVMVDAEAGSAIHSSGAQFLTGVLVRDLSANTIILATPVQASSGALKSNAWPEPYRAFRYTIKAADLNNRENHVCQIIAFLNVGVSNQDSSFALSPLFMLTKP